MALNDAIKFLGRIEKDKDFRESLYMCQTQKDLQDYVLEAGYTFSFEEIDDAFRSLLLKCQSEDCAKLLTEVYNMYRILMGLELVRTP